MGETEALSLLVGGIYDAALDPARWPSVLGALARFVGGQAAGLLSKDSVSKAGTAYYHHGVKPHYMQLYAATFHKFDPMAGLYFFDVEQVVTIPELVAFDEFRQGRFYREWVKPQGWLDAANVVLDKSVTSYAYLSVIRAEVAGLVDDEMRGRMRMVAPHVRRAVLISRVIDLKTAEAARLADTVDGLAAGVFLVDATGRIVHANTAAHAALSAGDYLKTVGGRLTAGDPRADQALHAVLAAAGESDAALGIRGIALPLLAREGERYIAHVLPLTSGARGGARTAYAATAALFVQKAALSTPSRTEVIAKAYKLTPTELRILLAVVEIGGIPEVAEALGISAETVKTHLRRLYQKTGAHRQADLVKLVAGFSNPLSG